MNRPPVLGFTLIELVLSAALMSMIMVGAYLCLRAGVASQTLVNTREEILQNARVALALLSADLRCACPLSKKIDFVGMHRMVGETEADNLDFATHNFTPRRRRESDWCEVSYFLDKDPATGTFNLWRRRDPTPDEAPFSGGKREQIARGVLSLQFAFYDGFDWFEEWGDPDGHGKAQNSLRDRSNLSGFPEAVRITLAMDPDPRMKKAGDGKEKSNEPPLVFQTVARLNLAGVGERNAASGSGPTNGPAGASDSRKTTEGSAP